MSSVVAAGRWVVGVEPAREGRRWQLASRHVFGGILALGGDFGGSAVAELLSDMRSLFSFCQSETGACG